MRLQDLLLARGGQTILRVKEFRLAEGERLAVIGPNGAGKSTLLKVLALLERPTTGAVFFRGVKVTAKNALAFRRRMAVVFQEPLLLNTTVFNNVAQGLKFRGIDGAELQRRVDYWLERLSITGLRSRTPLHLSGGEAQRVNLARAFVLEPEIIFLDEPFSALDFPTRFNLLEELGELLVKTGTAAVFVTHDFTEIPFLTDNVAVMDRGEVVCRGKLWEVKESGTSIPAVRHLLRPLNMSRRLDNYL